MLVYPVVIHKDPGSSFGVIVPDLPGCFSWGDTQEEALLNTVEAIECHVEGLLIDSDPIPQPSAIANHQINPDFEGGVWALVSVDLSKLSGKTKRVNITIPERILGQVDKFASEHGETRSGVLATAVIKYVSDQTGKLTTARVPLKKKRKAQKIGKKARKTRTIA